VYPLYINVKLSSIYALQQFKEFMPLGVYLLKILEFTLITRNVYLREIVMPIVEQTKILLVYLQPIFRFQNEKDSKSG